MFLLIWIGGKELGFDNCKFAVIREVNARKTAMFYIIALRFADIITVVFIEPEVLTLTLI